MHVKRENFPTTFNDQSWYGLKGELERNCSRLESRRSNGQLIRKMIRKLQQSVTHATRRRRTARHLALPPLTSIFWHRLVLMGRRVYFSDVGRLSIATCYGCLGERKKGKKKRKKEEREREVATEREEDQLWRKEKASNWEREKERERERCQDWKSCVD